MHCRELGIRRPRNKYTDITENPLPYYKKRKRKALRARIPKRRMIRLLKNSSYKEMTFTENTDLYSKILLTRITIIDTPSHVAFLQDHIPATQAVSPYRVFGQIRNVSPLLVE